MPSAQAPLEEPVLNRPSTANPKRPPSPNTQAIAGYNNKGNNVVD